MQQQIGAWARAAAAWHDWQGAKFARFGDNMREVAVTEGDKVAAQIQFGYSVNGYGVGDLVQVRQRGHRRRDRRAGPGIRGQPTQLAADLRNGGSRHDSVREAARIELGLRAFLKAGGFKGFTDHVRGPARPGAAARASPCSG